eukprot:COSAG01_NODE_1656_length_9595_cov_4.929150_7_plen_75_part_00
MPVERRPFLPRHTLKRPACKLTTVATPSQIDTEVAALGALRQQLLQLTGVGRVREVEEALNRLDRAPVRRPFAS